MYGRVLAVPGVFFAVRNRPARTSPPSKQQLTALCVSGDAALFTVMTLARRKGYRREPFPFRETTETDFQQALASAATRSADAVSGLENATRECVRELKSAGVTPERVIITMRAYVRHIMETRIFSKPPDNLHTVLEGLCDRLAAWCLDEYFPRENERSQLVE